MKSPETGCYFCDGSGIVSADRALETSGILQPEQRCLCTVSNEDAEALLDLIDDILKRFVISLDVSSD